MSLTGAGSAECSGCDPQVRVAAAQFGVGRDGQAAGVDGGVLPVLPVGHGLGEDGFLLLVAVAHRPVGGSQFLVPSGASIVTGLAGGVGFGGGADGALVGVDRAEPGQPQFPADVAGSPGGLGGVGVPDQPQPAVTHGPDVRRAGRAEGEEGLVPGGPLIRRVPGGLGADRVVRVVIAVHLPVGSDRGRLAFPFLPDSRIVRHRAERRDSPHGRDLGSVLAEPLLAVVHHGGDLRQVSPALGVRQLGDPFGPGALRLRQQRVDALPDPGVQDAGDVPGAGQVT